MGADLFPSAEVGGWGWSVRNPFPRLQYVGSDLNRSGTNERSKMELEPEVVVLFVKGSSRPRVVLG